MNMAVALPLGIIVLSLIIFGISIYIMRRNNERYKDAFRFEKTLLQALRPAIIDKITRDAPEDRQALVRENLEKSFENDEYVERIFHDVNATLTDKIQQGGQDQSDIGSHPMVKLLVFAQNYKRIQMLLLFLNFPLVISFFGSVLSILTNHDALAFRLGLGAFIIASGKLILSLVLIPAIKAIPTTKVGIVVKQKYDEWQKVRNKAK